MAFCIVRPFVLDFINLSLSGTGISLEAGVGRTWIVFEKEAPTDRVIPPPPFMLMGFDYPHVAISMNTTIADNHRVELNTGIRFVHKLR